MGPQPGRAAPWRPEQGGPEAAAPHLAARGRSRNAGPLGGGGGPSSRAQEGAVPEAGVLRRGRLCKAREASLPNGPPGAVLARLETIPLGPKPLWFSCFLSRLAGPVPRPVAGAFFVQILVLGTRGCRGDLGALRRAGAPRRAPPLRPKAAPRRRVKGKSQRAAGTEKEGVAPGIDPSFGGANLFPRGTSCHPLFSCSSRLS